MRKKRMRFIGDNIIEVTAYTAPDIPAYKLRCQHKGGKSTEAQAKYNHKKSIEKLILKVENTCPQGCLLVTYTVAPKILLKIPEEEQLDKVFKYLKKVIDDTKKYYESQSYKCAYIASIESGDDNGRIHCHVLYNQEAGIKQNEIEKKWKYGKVKTVFIHGTCDYDFEGISATIKYILKAPLKKIVGRAFITPKENIEDISEAEFSSIQKNPVSLEKSKQGYKIIGSQLIGYSVYGGKFTKIKVRLIKQTRSDYFKLKQNDDYDSYIANQLPQLMADKGQEVGLIYKTVCGYT